MSFKFLHLADHEPGEIVKKAFDKAFFTSINYPSAPPILFLDLKTDTAGHCNDEYLTERGEVVLNKTYTSTSRNVTELTAVAQLLTVAIHEWAHRLTPDHVHHAVFYAVNLCLQVRAQLQNNVRLYDFQNDAPIAPGDITRATDALAWAYSTGYKYAFTILTAEECAAEIEAEYRHYKTHRASQAKLLTQRSEELNNLKQHHAALIEECAVSHSSRALWRGMAMFTWMVLAIWWAT